MANEQGGNTSPPEEDGSSSGMPRVVRRRVLDLCLGASVFAWMGSATYPIIRYLLPIEGAIEERSVKLGLAGDFQKNSGTLFRIGSKPGLLLRAKSGEFRAFIAICSHLDCTVQFKEDEQIIWCACHNGRYNLNGINIAGPPPRPLTPLDVRLKGDEVHVSFTA